LVPDPGSYERKEPAENPAIFILMALTRNRQYLIMILACMLGYVWLYFEFAETQAGNSSVEVCLTRRILHLPCPSCGSTRSIISLLRGDFTGAMKINPAGYLIALIMVLAPLWITWDLATGKKSFFEFFRRMEAFLRKPKYAMPLIVLIILNWIWNITKGL
jgi:hypothetical protein